MLQENFIEILFSRNSDSSFTFPDKESSSAFIDDLFAFLFLPKIVKNCRAKKDLEDWYELLKNQFSDLIYGALHNKDKTAHVTATFFAAIPAIYQKLMNDANAVLNFDPAASSLEEVLVAYPGFYATAIYRLSHQLFLQDVSVLPRLFTECAHSKTGIDIHPGAKIGNSFFIDHGTGIVIGGTTIIGNNVKIYQGVTLGALNVAKELAKIKRHPTIKDNVIIYSGATILGGDTTIGHDSVIGGNVWLTNSVPSYSIVYHKSEIRVKDNNPLPEALNFVI